MEGGSERWLDLSPIAMDKKTVDCWQPRIDDPSRSLMDTKALLNLKN